MHCSANDISKQEQEYTTSCVTNTLSELIEQNLVTQELGV